ncbi:MAG: DUF433 domain-containing protein [Bryobacteraceae bacterium]
MIEPGKMGGQPCIRGMRITVRRVRAWYDCGRAISGSPLREWCTPACGPAGPPTR